MDNSTYHIVRCSSLFGFMLFFGYVVELILNKSHNSQLVAQRTDCSFTGVAVISTFCKGMMLPSCNVPVRIAGSFCSLLTYVLRYQGTPHSGAIRYAYAFRAYGKREKDLRKETVSCSPA